MAYGWLPLRICIIWGLKVANLPEQASFDAVYQLEKKDRVLAGAGNTANRQAQALANRTAYLKQQLADLSNSTDPEKGAAMIGFAGGTLAEKIRALELLIEEGGGGGGGSNILRTISSSAPTGIPQEGEEWIVV